MVIRSIEAAPGEQSGQEGRSPVFAPAAAQGPSFTVDLRHSKAKTDGTDVPKITDDV
jgi:hypothetical protein